MDKYDVHYSVNCSLRSKINHPLLTDRWKTEIVEAENEEEAIEIVRRMEKGKDNKVNYVLSCKLIVD